MNLTSVPALQDNYIWLLNDTTGRCIVVDPGESSPVLLALAENDWRPDAIILTHHHHDHVDGVKGILEQYPDIPVYGPEETRTKGATHIVSEGDKVTLPGAEFTVIATPGHTLGHISYFSPPYLFCGDTMFSGGCGRLFEGTAEQMFQSFQKINSLPGETLVCCAHEYTLSNLIFANTVYPQNREIEAYLPKIKELRAKKHMTLPTTLDLERKINIFLMTQDPELVREINKETIVQHEWQVFSALRRKKDSF